MSDSLLPLSMASAVLVSVVVASPASMLSASAVLALVPAILPTTVLLPSTVVASAELASAVLALVVLGPVAPIRHFSTYPRGLRWLRTSSFRDHVSYGFANVLDKYLHSRNTSFLHPVDIPAEILPHIRHRFYCRAVFLARGVYCQGRAC